MITRQMIYALLTMIVICGESSAMRKATVAALALVLAAGGCGAHQTPSGGPVGVVAGFYPLQYVAEQVGGDRVRVTNLAQPGAEPHDLELSPHQLASIADADVVVYLPGFQASLDEAVSQEAPARAFDAAVIINSSNHTAIRQGPTRAFSYCRSFKLLSELGKLFPYRCNFSF